MDAVIAPPDTQPLAGVCRAVAALLPCILTCGDGMQVHTRAYGWRCLRSKVCKRSRLKGLGRINLKAVEKFLEDLSKQLLEVLLVSGLVG